MRRILVFSVFALMSGAAFAQDLTAAPQITKPLYQWRTEVEKEDDDAFKHCLVKNMYDNGTVMMLAENKDGVKRIALQFPKSKLAQGEHVDLTLQVDRRDVFPAEAVAVSPQILTIGIPDALPDQFRKGEALYVRGPNDEVIYRLDGAEGAILALQDCISTNKNSAVKLAEKTDDAEFEAKQKAEEAARIKEAILTKEAARKSEPKEIAKEVAKEIVIAEAAPKPVPAPPVQAAPKSIPVPPPPTVAAPVPLPKPEPKPEPKPLPVPSVKAEPQKETKKEEPKKEEPKKVEKPKNILPDPLHAIFEAADLKPTSLLGKNDALDYAWKKDGMSVGVKTVTSSAGVQFATMAYLRKLRTTCAGPFVAEASLPVKNAVKHLTWLVAEAACAGNKEGDTITAMLFTDSGKAMTVYVIEAPAANGAGAIRARDRLIAAILK
jgi:hypothetical protein